MMSNDRQRWSLAAFVAVLCVFAAVGIGFVLRQNQPQNIAAFANRFTGFSTLALTAPAEMTLAVDADTFTATWSEYQTADAAERPATLSIQSDIVPLTREDAKRLQVDVAIGGTQNTEGLQQFGFGASFTVRLWKGTTALTDTCVQLPLSSKLGRVRLYSVVMNYADLAPDGYQLCWSLTPIEGKIAAGTLQCANLEVMEQ